ncbi:MAG: hypothetical protein LQ351_007563 [Letrouitia transgressa]|nr:MAG: hypothetical protein LQ351_007563 [Letrouitia transgressa]
MSSQQVPIPPNGNHDVGRAINAIDAVLYTCSTAIIILRLYTRIHITRNLGLDDVTIVIAQAITTVGKAFVAIEVCYGLGRHRYYVPSQRYIVFLKYQYLDWAQCFIVLAVSKISFCLFLLRLSQFNRLRHALYTLIEFIMVTHVTFVLLFVLQCHPINKAWDEEIIGMCFSKQIIMNIIVAQGIISILTDFICAAFPIVLLRNANISPRTKLALCTLMGFGVITGTISLARTCFAWQTKSKDVSWVAIPNDILRLFEVNVGVITACMPMMKPFARYVKARITGQDPHQILLRKDSTPSVPHTRWYSWLLGSKRVGWSRKYNGKSNSWSHKRNPEPVHIENGRAEEEETIEIETPPEGALRLPLQGVQGLTD